MGFEEADFCFPTCGAEGVWVYICVGHDMINGFVGILELLVSSGVYRGLFIALSVCFGIDKGFLSRYDLIMRFQDAVVDCLI